MRTVCDVCREPITDAFFYGGFSAGHKNLLLHEHCTPEGMRTDHARQDPSFSRPPAPAQEETPPEIIERTGPSPLAEIYATEEFQRAVNPHVFEPGPQTCDLCGEFAEDLDTLKNPAPGVTLVSHGWVKRCRVCETTTHAKWHELARGTLNPVALIERIESMLPADVARPLVQYIVAVTGLDYAAMQRALVEEGKADPARLTDLETGKATGSALDSSSSLSPSREEEGR